MSHRVAWVAVVAIVILAAVVGGNAPTSTPLVPDLVHAQGNYKYTGTASCGSSSCHGSTKPKAEFPKMNEVYARAFGSHRPARTTVEVSGLPGDGLLVEIDAIAYIPA